MKSSGLMESLEKLPDDKITLFFKGVKDTFETLPTDPQIKKFFDSRYEEFGETFKEEKKKRDDNADLKHMRKMAKEHPHFKPYLMEMMKMKPDETLTGRDQEIFMGELGRYNFKLKKVI